jgi:L-ascorbate 6-phosphate lactonase
LAEGPALVAEIAGTAVPAGGVGIWFLNHAGFALKFAGGTTVYVDPYLSDALERLTRGTPEEHRRNYPPPLEGGDVTNADLVLVSHDHLDHFDPDALRAIARASPKARFVAPHRLRADFAAIGVEGDRYVPADVGPTLTFATTVSSATSSPPRGSPCGTRGTRSSSPAFWRPCGESRPRC